MANYYKDEKVYNDVIKARTILLMSNAFFGTLAMHLNIVESTLNNTAWVDGQTMGYNAKFWASLKDHEQVFVVAHEVMHCAYKHMSRRGNRDPQLWNIANDFRINWDLKEAGMNGPGQPISLKDMLGSEKKKGHLLDEQFKDNSSEEIYEKLLRHKDKLVQRRIVILIGDGSGDGKANDPGGCGGVVDAGTGTEKDKNGGAAQSPDSISREWETIVRMAVGVAQRQAGKVPGYLGRLIEQFKEPRISWRELTRNFVDACINEEPTWQRPNRRHVWQDLILPSNQSVNRLSKLVFFADTSGSITKEMLEQYMGEIASVIDDQLVEELHVVYADAAVHHHDVFMCGDTVHAKNLKGGGRGTDFRDSFRWLRENAPDAVCAIYLTDMATSSFGEDPGIPVLWAAYTDANTLKHYQPGFGETIHVYTE